MFKHFSIARLTRQLTSLWPWIKIVFVSLLVIAFGYILLRLLPPVLIFAQKMLLKPQSFISFTRDPIDVLQTSADRTNILLLGMRGSGEGALLTDSLLVFSYHHPSQQISIISLPRDLWVDSLKAKINTAYYYGEQKATGQGLNLAKSAVSEITNLPIHYALNLSFDGFKQAVDLVGGIDLTVDRSFDDFKYPIPGRENVLPESDRYELLHFDSGPQYFDGDRALKFVRSRNAEGDEGTDFARNHRQQKVIVAFQQKMLQQKILLDPQKIAQLADLYHQYVVTDMVPSDYGAFAKLLLLASNHPLKTISLTTGDAPTQQLGVLENPKNRTPYQGQYVLIARDNNWPALHQYIQNQLTN